MARAARGKIEGMERVVILGRGGAGKSTLARELGAELGLPLIELDLEFWSERLEPLAPTEWVTRQRQLAEQDRWIMDGDLGPYDNIEPRLRRADTVIVLDVPLWRSAYRAWRRGRERWDFWVWTANWRRNDRPGLLCAIVKFAPDADVVVLRTPTDVRSWRSSVRR